MTATPVNMNCAQLNSYTPVPNQVIKVTQNNCVLTRQIPLSASNVVIQGQGSEPLTLKAKNGGGNDDAFNVKASNVLIENFRFRRADDDSLFNEGITVDSGVGNVTIESVSIDNATSQAGIRVPSNGQNICIRATNVTGAANIGFIVKSTGAGGTVEFRAAKAMRNGAAGFKIEQPTSLAEARFYRSLADRNRGPGFELAGGYVELLCSESTDNEDDPPDTEGKGIWRRGSGTLHIENVHVIDNENVGIVATDSGTKRIIATTLAENEGGARQIQASNASIYNTVARGSIFLDGSSQACSNNIANGTSGGCTPTSGTVAFRNESIKSNLLNTASGNDGVDDGIDPRTIPALAGLVKVAGTRDQSGTFRPKDGDGNGSNLYDVGAYEVQSAPCTSECIADCDCSGEVSLGEVQVSFNIFLGTAPLSQCNSADDDGDGEVMLGETQMAFNAFLGDCSSGAGGGGGGGSVSPTLTIGYGETIAGNPVTIPISISGTEGISSGAQLDILYNSAVLSISDPGSSCVIDNRLSVDHDLGASLPASPSNPLGFGRMRLVVYSKFDGSAIERFTDGPIASCTFQILSNASPGYYTLDGQRQQVIDNLSSVLLSTVVDGTVRVCGGCGCD